MCYKLDCRSGLVWTVKLFIEICALTALFNHAIFAEEIPESLYRQTQVELNRLGNGRVRIAMQKPEIPMPCRLGHCVNSDKYALRLSRPRRRKNQITLPRSLWPAYQLFLGSLAQESMDDLAGSNEGAKESEANEKRKPSPGRGSGQDMTNHDFDLNAIGAYYHVCSSVSDFEIISVAMNDNLDEVQVLPNTWVFTTKCRMPSHSCYGIGPGFESHCEQMKTWVQALARLNKESPWQWHWITVDSSCNCGVRPKAPEYKKK
ncbi:uncharacterized protein LOC106153693 [Lingula anatina]|uniref:Uncharacterized protein LOC106153693 n=1 Tax=Lingula anatina TaxID=7574 RepID=A0A1S3HDK3_LINAN|nr:uncharacterized protein LOC106153693 [Lingula anatina]|eukprot:XP_013383174.1 uncharacterized protein LOC106153693 [Lingula anatina]